MKTVFYIVGCLEGREFDPVEHGNPQPDVALLDALDIPQKLLDTSDQAFGEQNKKTKARQEYLQLVQEYGEDFKDFYLKFDGLASFLRADEEAR